MHETQIIFGIRIVILKNQKLGFQFPIFFILPTQNTSIYIYIKEHVCGCDGTDTTQKLRRKRK